MAAEGRGTAKQMRRLERAGRILDAAADLVERYGYDKTTLDDVARQAGVAKGTLYLHWNTREELFTALMRRERMTLAHDFLNRAGAEPEPPTLRGMFKLAALALLRRPLIRAVFTRDVDVIGKLIRVEHSHHPGRKEIFELLLDFLSQKNLVRRDLSPHSQSYLVSSVFLGFFVMAAWLPDQGALTDEEQADMVADTVVSALERGHPVSPEQAEVASQEFLAYIREMTEQDEAAFQQELR